MSEYAPASLILAAEPTRKISVPSGFFDRDKVFFSLLSKPSKLRESGWNLLTFDTPRFKRGDFWEAGNKDRKLVRIFADGSLVVTGVIDQDFLGWSQKSKPARLHALAAIEFVFEFADFYKKILLAIRENGSLVSNCRFKVGIKGLNDSNEKLELRPYELSRWGGPYIHQGSPFVLEGDFMDERSQQVSDRIYDSRAVAYNLVSILFRKFGVMNDKIPYSKTEDGQEIIDTDKIMSIT